MGHVRAPPTFSLRHRDLDASLDVSSPCILHGNRMSLVLEWSTGSDRVPGASVSDKTIEVKDHTLEGKAPQITVPTGWSLK